MEERLWKVLRADRYSLHGGTGQWPPAGEWREVPGDLDPCRNGLHLCRRGDLVHWLGPEIWEAECEGEMVVGDNKIVCRRARLVRPLDTWCDRAARLFACDCAERALPLWTAVYPADGRPAEAIRVARLYAEGGAAWSAARSAAESAAWSAAWSAARAWQTERLFSCLYPEE